MSMLLDSSFLAKIEPLTLVSHRVRAGQTAGERRSTKRGTSVEFADYRNYTKGDDLRRVDWNIYARLERPFVKLFEEEEDLAVYVLLDGSESMDWGGDGEEKEKQSEAGNGQSQNKWLYARRLAGALGHIALTSGDRLTVSAIYNLQSATFGPTRGRGSILRLLQWLEQQTVQGATDLNGNLRTAALQSGRAGLVILVSDLFSQTGYVEGLTALAARGHKVVLLHLLSPDEVEPPLGGDLRLLDLETGDPQEVTIDSRMRSLYRRRLDGWRDEIRTACRARDMHYHPIETGTAFEQIVLTDLRRGGVVR